jgi:hypothetical protein
MVSFGWNYDFNGGGLGRAGGIPEFLLLVRDRAAGFAGLEPDALEHTLVIEYTLGAAIGWHKDRPTFDDVIGVSLLSPCTFRLRRKAGAKWERRSFTAEPAPPICCADPPALSGSTASRRSTRYGTRSRSVVSHRREGNHNPSADGLAELSASHADRGDTRGCHSR